MDLTKLRSITNTYQDVRLISLRTWKSAAEIIPRDQGGPYMVGQEGYDPADLTVTPDEFVLGKSGRWVSLGHFFKLPLADRREEFVFGTAAEVMQLLEKLPSKPSIFRAGEAAAPEPAAEHQDELNSAFLAATQRSSPPSASPERPPAPGG
jgi:hypothetical protein